MDTARAHSIIPMIVLQKITLKFCVRTLRITHNEANIHASFPSIQN